MMTSQPLISVIIPVYNGEKYLTECLDSITGQTYPHLDIIVVDDGSTDTSRDIVKRYQDRDNRFSVHVLQHAGVSEARNHGLAVAKGEYVTFVDADDMIAPEFVETMLALCRETGAQIAAARFTDNPDRLGLGDEEYIVIEGVEYIAQVLYKRMSDNSVWGKLYETSLWHDVRFKSMRYEDLEVYPRVCFNVNKVTYTPARLYFRSNASSFINTFSVERLDSLKAVDMIEAFVRDNSDSPRLLSAARSRKLSAAFNIYLLTAHIPAHRDTAIKAWNTVRNYRAGCLRDRHVSPAMKTAILLSYTGGKTLSAINSILKISR